VLLPELLDDLGAGRRLVAEHASSGAVHERIDHVVRESVRVRRERLRRHHAHELPVPSRRVLALRALEQAARHRGRPGLRRTPVEGLYVPQAERLEARQVETADRSRDVAQCVRALVSVLGGVRQLAGADGIEHDDARPGHRAILGTLVATALGLIAFVGYVLAVVGVAAAVTWVVVRVTPSRKPDGPARS
jgi:hypothetical protein